MLKKRLKKSKPDLTLFLLVLIFCLGSFIYGRYFYFYPPRKVTITSEPKRVKIEVNGKKISGGQYVETPFTIAKLPNNKPTIVLKNSGFYSKRLEVENSLAEVRRKAENVADSIRRMEQERNNMNEQIDAVRSSLEEVRLERGALEVRQTAIKEQLLEDNQNLEEILDRLPNGAVEAEWEQSLIRIGNRIQRLGAINLAAIDEYKVQSDRKQYLDAQNTDLETALATLENAIRKIDVETRTRFKETFEQVNNKLKHIFPKLFGGGHA